MTHISELYVIKRNALPYSEQPPELMDKQMMMLHHAVQLELWCEMDFYTFPFDQHVGKISAVFWEFPT